MSESSWKQFADRGSGEKESVEPPPDGQQFGSAVPDFDQREPDRFAPLRASAEAPLTVRLTAGLAGMLSAGSVVLGVVMLAVMVVLQIRSAQVDVLEATTGPGWPRTAVQLVAGIAAESLWIVGHRSRSNPMRVLTAIGAIVIAFLALWWVWWR